MAEKVDQPQGRRGCLVMNCASEFAQSDPRVAKLVADGTAHFKQAFFNGIKQAQAEGDIPKNKDANALADYLVGCKSGLETMAKAGATPLEMKNAVRVMMSALA